MRTTSLPATMMRQPLRQPLYAQVREQLLARIRDGEWGAGESLPNEHALASDFHVSVGTIRRAVADLQANGVLSRQQGRGTYVAGRGASAVMQRFCGVRGSDGRTLELNYELLSLRRRTADEMELQLLASAGSGVIEIVQRVAAAGRTIGLEVSALPSSLFPRLETQIRFGQPLYPVLADYGLLVARVDDAIGIESADAGVAAQIGRAEGHPMLAVTRVAFALDGQAIERRSARYLPEHVRYAAVQR